MNEILTEGKRNSHSRDLYGDDALGVKMLRFHYEYNFFVVSGKNFYVMMIHDAVNYKIFRRFQLFL